jgi:hypothetical protein
LSKTPDSSISALIPDINTPGTVATFSGIIKKVPRYTPDIAEDYQVHLDRPLTGITTGRGDNQSLSDIFVAVAAPINIENYVNSHVTFTASLEWGYAESKYLSILTINETGQSPVPLKNTESVNNTRVVDAYETNLSIKKINDPLFKLPAYVNKGQIKNYFQLGDIYFALVMQGSVNVPLDIPRNFKTTYIGILIAKLGDTQWTDFTGIIDKRSDNKNNPYYMWTYSNRILLTVIDQNGAGSGEGKMKLFAFSKNETWELTGCYYFGGRYNSSETDGDYFAYSSKLSEQEPAPLSECNNVTLIQNSKLPL